MKKKDTGLSIPLTAGSLFLIQKVIGDKLKSLKTPLAEFDVDMLHEKDPSGNYNKHLYRRRRRLVAATLLSLQDAFENNKFFSERSLNETRTEPVQYDFAGIGRSSESFVKEHPRTCGQRGHRIGEKDEEKGCFEPSTGAQ